MQNIALEEARALLIDRVKQIAKIEEVTVRDARNSVLAEDIVAPLNNPPFDRSPLDGYAFQAADSTGATKETPVTLQVIGTVFAGDSVAGDVQKGQAVRIMTGAPIPKGCDCVLRQEDTDEGEENVGLYACLDAYDNYCYAGEDIKKGTVLLKKGEKVSPIEIGRAHV